jgi:predicted RNase H-like HicB family nuclease
MNMDLRARAEELAKRPYLIMTSVEETTDEQPIFFARVLEIDGCFGQGETHEAAVEDLRFAMVDLIESLLEDGLPVPDPTKLIELTLGTAVQGSYTFTKQNNVLKLKQIEVDQNAYFLTA